MTMRDIAGGKSLVEDMLRDECTKRGVPLELVEWGQSDEGFDRDEYSMAYTIAGVRRVARFTHLDLMDARGVREVHERLRALIAGLMAKAVPIKKIGF